MYIYIYIYIYIVCVFELLDRGEPVVPLPLVLAVAGVLRREDAWVADKWGQHQWHRCKIKRNADRLGK